jgi:hypothetical protein
MFLLSSVSTCSQNLAPSVWAIHKPRASGVWGSTGARSCPAVPGSLNRQLTEFTFERLLAFAIAGLAIGVGNVRALVMLKVLGYLGIKGTLHK